MLATHVVLRSLMLAILSTSGTMLESATSPDHPYGMVPYHYRIWLRLNISTSTVSDFEGRTDISFFMENKRDTTNRSRVVCLHYTDKITTAHLVSLRKKGRAMKTKLDLISRLGSFVCFGIKTQATIGETGILSIVHSGKTRDDNLGFYSSKNREYLVTQFQPEYARTMFPCVDSPAYKARFSLVLTYNASYHSLSNEILISRSRTDDVVTDTYAATPKMSTYLLCLFVSNFESTQLISRQGVPIRFWTSKSETAYAESALSYAVQVLDWFENLLQIPIPLKKIDIVSISDIYAAGMENWGLITMRSDIALADMDYPYWRLMAARLISHEIAHNWFGNLATSRRWSDVWIQEGLTSYFDCVAVQNTFPSWYELDISIFSLKMFDLLGDSRNTTTCLAREEVDIDVSYLQPSLYGKASFIMRMLSNHFEEKPFINAVRRFISKHAYSNYTRHDFFKEISDLAGFDMDTAMENWAVQNGLPLIELTGSTLSVRDYLYLTGRREKEILWTLPIRLKVISANGSVSELKVMCRGDSVNLPVDDGDVLLINQDYHGYYISRYDRHSVQLLAQLMESRNHSILTDIERAGLLLDHMLLLEDGLVNESDVKGLLGNLHLAGTSLYQYVEDNSSIDHLSRFLTTLRIWSPEESAADTS